MSDVVLLLPNTDHLQLVQYYVRGCTTSTKYGQPSTSWTLCQILFYFYQKITVFTKLKICQRLFYFYQLLTAFIELTIMSEVVLLLPNTDSLHQVDNYVRGWSTSTKYWQPSTSWRLCQMFYYFYHIMTAFNNLKIMSDVVLLLPNTDHLQLVEDYVRGCSTSTVYWPFHQD
jgi:uncharacterized protein (DUF1499 family)